MFHIFLSIIFLSQETRWERCGSYGKRRRIHRDHHLLWSCFSRSSAWIVGILLLSLKSSRFEVLDMLSLPCVFCSKRYRPNSATFRISMFLQRFFTIYISSERDSTELLLKHYTITFQLQHLPSSLKPWVFFSLAPSHHHGLQPLVVHIQDQREILQERQLINNPVTWSLPKMDLMTGRGGANERTLSA